MKSLTCENRLPASYWYLQHFDIVELSKHVEFFNIMSYDMHGGWDQGNKWTGSFLNAHTNLTEIANALDLVWRNNIDPEKVVLGVAFYSRVFTLKDINCKEPGCQFSSVGQAGPCSQEAGILMNSELDEIRHKFQASPQLSKTEAVQVMTWNNQWTAYDDEHTLKMRADFARGQCLGGLMVWAISHDLKNAKYSKALASAAGRKGQWSLLAKSPSQKERGGAGLLQAKSVPIPQCRWTGCGEGKSTGPTCIFTVILNLSIVCPSGFSPIIRSDKWKTKKNELVLSSIGCEERTIRTWCCPDSEPKPECGWYSHNNGIPPKIF
jgi:hypothetical protein